MSCSQPEYSGLLMSCQTVDWVSRGVVASSGFSPLTFLAVLEQGFGFLVSGGGHGLQLLLPDLARRSALSFPGIPQWARIHCRTIVHSWGEAAGLSAVGGLAGQGYLR